VNRLFNEPVLIGAAIRAVIYAGIQFGWKISIDQLGALMIAVEAVLAVVTRALVTPNQLAEARVAEGLSPTQPRDATGGPPKMPVILLAMALSGAFLVSACAAKTTRLQTMQVSHDSLALAQDLEAQICWGVGSVKDSVPNRSECSTPLAQKIGLTPGRHQAINLRLAQAFTLHATLTNQMKTGINPDLSELASLIETILSELKGLQQVPEVVRLTATVQKAKVQ